MLKIFKKNKIQQQKRWQNPYVAKVQKNYKWTNGNRCLVFAHNFSRLFWIAADKFTLPADIETSGSV